MPKWIRDYLIRQGAAISPAVVLALSRGLFHAPIIPERDEELYDTFVWTKRCYELPLGCTIFTDGSLLDSKLGNQCLALGWSFVVIGPEGQLCDSAYGVPPRWISTIQGAELWAIFMALHSVAFPEALYTDCNTVRIGLQRSAAWAASSKRRFSRVWTSVLDMMESPDLINWMPAHTTESSIGHSKCSNGELVTEDMRLANQLADEGAKTAAESVRLPLNTRRWLIGRDKQLRQLFIFLGKLTCEANHFSTSEGFIRDSDGRGTRLRKGKGKSSNTSPKKGRGGPEKRGRKKQFSKWTMPEPLSSSKGMPMRRPCRSRKQVCHGPVNRAKWNDEAVLREWWVDAKGCTPQPRCHTLPSAKDRLEAVRARVVARGADCSAVP